MIGVVLAAALALSPVGEVPLPKTWRGQKFTGLSGLTHVTNNVYYAMCDSRGQLYTLLIDVDLATGAVTNAVVADVVRLRGGTDNEGIAWDAALSRVWVTNEDDGSIRAYHPATGEETACVAVPPIFDAYRFNLSFESLALSADGRELWTCNEEALCRRAAVGREKKKAKPVNAETPEVDDGPVSTREHGSRIRLLRFTRGAPKDPWTATGQWMYETDRVGGSGFAGMSRCGVADLLCLEDGTLLALEREMSIKKGGLLPSFRCRIYEIDRTDADDVSNELSLAATTCRPVTKKRLFGASTGLAMYEGICLGPVLADGSRSVLLVSDGDEGAANRILALRLKR